MAAVGIIGAGATGLVTAKTLLADGHDITLFEQDAELGGVWASSRWYPGVTTQNTKGTFAFSDFPFADSDDERPTGAQMLGYLTNYADRHGLTELIRLDTRVRRARPADGRWLVTSQHAEAAETTTDTFDHLIVCNGTYSTPKQPDIPGLAEFEAAGGRTFHSTTFDNADLVAGHHTVVVGFGKSACDLATAASRTAAHTTHLFRSGNYVLPRRLLGVHLDRLFFTRFSGMFFPYVRKNRAETFLHGRAGAAAMRLYWWTVRTLLERSTGLERTDIFPEQPIEHSFSCSTPLSPEGFFDRVQSGDIDMRRGSIDRFVAGGVVLDDGERLNADRVIFATGFRQDTTFFDRETEQKLRDENGRLRLHRSIVPPSVPGLLFNGYNSSIFTQLTSEVGAVWLTEYIAGRLSMPTTAAMEAELDELQRCRDANQPDGTATECVVPFVFQYLEDLLGDLDLSPRRTGRFVRDWLMPIRTADYAGLSTELAERRNAAANSSLVAN